MSSVSAAKFDCVALWTRDFRVEQDAGRPSIARRIIDVMDAGGTTKHIVLEHHISDLGSPAVMAGTVARLFRDRWPLQTLVYSHADSRRRVLDELTRLQPRTIYLDTVRCLAFARDIRRALPDSRIVLDMDDLLSRRLASWRELDAPLALGYISASVGRAASVLSAEPARSLLLGYEIGALRRAEQRAVELADTIVLVSPYEASLLAAETGPDRRATIVAVPPARTLHRTRRPRTWPLAFVFIGSDGLLQNRITIDRLIALWRQARPPNRLEIVGSMQRAYPDLPAGVEMRGFVLDLETVYAPDRVLLAPSYVPGGIKTKVLESFAYGCPVVGNELTFEGMDLAEYPLVCADDDALTELVLAPEAYRAAFDAAADTGQRLLTEQHTMDRFAESWSRILALEPTRTADAA